MFYTMRRPAILIPTAIAAVVLFAMPFAGRANDSASLVTGATDPARQRLDTRLRREGYTLVGELRRKGDFIIVTANRGSAPWRLVVDHRSGEIIGRKPIDWMLPDSE
jgi:hypothetical protein